MSNHSPHRAAPNAKRPGRHRAAPRNRVRIIGGEWRSRLLEFPDAEGLRPTADRVRETLFNWLGQTLYGKRCLDLFAGSGALGFEAHSRGAERVVMVENRREVVAALRENAARLDAARLDVVYSDARTWLKTDTAKFDVVFLDPPFRENLLDAVLAEIRTHLAAQGVVYVESGADFSAAAEAAGWAVAKTGSAGAVRFGLLTLAEIAEEK